MLIETLILLNKDLKSDWGGMVRTYECRLQKNRGLTERRMKIFGLLKFIFYYSPITSNADCTSSLVYSFIGLSKTCLVIPSSITFPSFITRM